MIYIQKNQKNVKKRTLIKGLDLGIETRTSPIES